MFTFKTGPYPRSPKLIRQPRSVEAVMSEAGHSAEVDTVRPPHVLEAVTVEAGARGHAECLNRGRVAQILVRRKLQPPCVIQHKLS